MYRLCIIMIFAGMLLQRAVALAEDDPVKSKLNTAREICDAELEKFRAAAGEWFDKREAAARKDGNKKLVDENRAERQAFDETGELPKAAPLALRQRMSTARAALKRAYALAVKEYTRLSRDEEAEAIENEMVLLDTEGFANVGSGFVSLFDGKSLAGWVGAVDGYTVEDGAISSKPDAGGNLFTEKEYGDFVLRLEFKLTPGSNNGLGIRCPLEGNGAFDGIELQVIDDSAERFANIKPWQHHGSVYGVVAAKTGFQKPVGEWNQEEVTVQGRHIKVVLNGATIVDADLDEATKNGTLDGRDHPGLARTKGHIGFLGHGAKVQFRNLAIKEL